MIRSEKVVRSSLSYVSTIFVISFLDRSPNFFNDMLSHLFNHLMV